MISGNKTSLCFVGYVNLIKVLDSRRDVLALLILAEFYVTGGAVL